MTDLVHLLLKIPRENTYTPESVVSFLSTLTNINKTPILKKLFGAGVEAFSLEIVASDGQISFYITCHAQIATFIETQIQGTYPLVVIQKTQQDPIPDKSLEVANVTLSKGSYYPINTFDKFTDNLDPLASILSVMSKKGSSEFIIFQACLESTSSVWQSNAATYAAHGVKKEDGTYSPREDQNIIKEKVAHPGFFATVRVGSQTRETLKEMLSSFGIFARSDGNSLRQNKSLFAGKANLNKKLRSRTSSSKVVLNIREIATLWHLPGESLKIQGVLWGKKVFSDPPTNLPVSADISDDQKKEINFFAKTAFKNQEVNFGVKSLDRLRHIWVIGKTGTGKSTMVANMAVDDVKKGRGVGIIDPHGDLCDDILNYIPSSRINQTIYFNPADREFPISLNPLEVTNREEAELVVSGLMAIFTKVWANVWSARMEYILRNSFLTLSEIPDTTLEDVLKILSNKSYRDKVLAKVTDPTLIQFWREEFEKMPDNLQKEAISPIQNKVGQFVTSPLIRRIIGSPKSSISIDSIMDDGKILLANLSQGRLGEDNSALLGAMLIAKFQLSAMRRVDRDKASRRPFYLYVDEFQNFATDSFVKILSEARKYGLALTLANQYMAQIPTDVQKAILGNAGTLISFAVGAEDASIIHKEFAEVFSQNDLVSLANFQIAIKLMVDGHSQRPFLATTLPLPSSKNENKEKVIKVSRERWSKK